MHKVCPYTLLPKVNTMLTFVYVCSFCSSGQPRIRAHSAAPSGRSPTPGAAIVAPGQAGMPDNWNPVLNMCPVALRQALLGDPSPKCRCSGYALPAITDIEFDDFVRRLSPIKQLLVVTVRSSL